MHQQPLRSPCLLTWTVTYWIGTLGMIQKSNQHTLEQLKREGGHSEHSPRLQGGDRVPLRGLFMHQQLPLCMLSSPHTQTPSRSHIHYFTMPDHGCAKKPKNNQKIPLTNYYHVPADHTSYDVMLMSLKY